MYIFDQSHMPPPEAFLTRREVVQALTRAGYPIASSYLATMVTRGGGPPLRKFGRRVLYQWGSTLEWAKARTRIIEAAPATTTRWNAA